MSATDELFYKRGVNYTFDEWQALVEDGWVFDPNTIQDDPEFVDCESPEIRKSNFKLKHTSPARNAGVDVGLTEDMFGDIHENKVGTDIGVDQYYGY